MTSTSSPTAAVVTSPTKLEDLEARLPGNDYGVSDEAIDWLLRFGGGPSEKFTRPEIFPVSFAAYATNGHFSRQLIFDFVKKIDMELKLFVPNQVALARSLYQDQPKGEQAILAMNPVDGDHRLFMLSSRCGQKPYLYELSMEGRQIYPVSMKVLYLKPGMPA